MRKQLSMNTKLLAMALIISAIGAGIGGIGLVSNEKTATKLADLYNKDLLGLQYADEAYVELMNARVAGLQHLLADNTDAYATYRKDFNDALTRFEQALLKYKATVTNEQEIQILSTLSTALASYQTKSPEMFNLSEQGKKKEASAYRDTNLAKVFNEVLFPKLKELQTISQNQAKQFNDESEHDSAFTITLIVSSVVGGLVLALLIALFMARGISKPINNLVSTLSDSSGQIGISSEQLSSASQEIANGAGEQASQIEETSSAMEELASMVKQNMQTALEASRLAEKSTAASRTGSEHMNRMVTAMTSIGTSASEIQNVIDVIDDIAFQTNMLALNAAVEAARAGEAGLGFAVVADEVKNLAKRSAQSAKETATMIKDTLARIEDGMEISRKLSEVFGTIVEQSSKVTEMTKEVEAASRQQDEGISQVNKAIVQFDSVVQTNAGSSEETASAAEELKSQVDSLNNVIESLYRIVSGKEFTQVHQEKTTLKPAAVAKKTVKPAPVKEAAKTAQKANAQKISFESDEEFSEF